jgi:hypothetical protein
LPSLEPVAASVCVRLGETLYRLTDPSNDQESVRSA